MANPKSPPQLDIDPPLMNSANPWATSLEDLTKLFSCESTGAVTTRTSLIQGFDHDDSKHQYLFFDPSQNAVSQKETRGTPRGSLNNLGYSPITLETYLGFIETITSKFPDIKKPFVISVTGTADEISQCYALILTGAKNLHVSLAMEINLSCPNIPNRPPPAYDSASLAQYLRAIPLEPEISVGIKTPPYTHATEFHTLIDTLEAEDADRKISFITATNTLGSCIVLAPDDSTFVPGLPAGGLGGLGGAPLHPLALGNVLTIRKLLDEKGLVNIRIIGVGGVCDAAGYRRMRGVGAYAVGVGTALGVEGVGVFGRIQDGLKGNW